MELTRELLTKLPMSIRIEIEENASRKDISQSELAAVQKHITEELQKHTAPGTRNDLKPTSAKSLAAAIVTSKSGIATVTCRLRRFAMD
jgi:hypothetical protein